MSRGEHILHRSGLPPQLLSAILAKDLLSERILLLRLVPELGLVMFVLIHDFVYLLDLRLVLLERNAAGMDVVVVQVEGCNELRV